MTLFRIISRFFRLDKLKKIQDYINKKKTVSKEGFLAVFVILTILYQNGIMM